MFDQLDDAIAWPFTDDHHHPLTEPLLHDHLVLDTTKPFGDQDAQHVLSRDGVHAGSGEGEPTGGAGADLALDVHEEGVSAQAGEDAHLGPAYGALLRRPPPAARRGTGSAPRPAFFWPGTSRQGPHPRRERQYDGSTTVSWNVELTELALEAKGGKVTERLAPE
ncbi:hypothetical protein [Streptomyces diastatochromogenes]|uniref:hypothetical protein n=1 Tax=Streptomyces diastatochromogenes TaxID=42236 RepID=UPI0036CBF6FF